jgi:drug/metabolite transporter (DMT)-like permease
MSPRTRAEFYLIAITFIWGSTFVFIKILLNDVSPLLYTTIRFSLASLLLTGMFYRRIRRLNRRSAQQGFVLGLLLALGFSLQTVGLQFTSASKSAFFTGMLVVFTPICQIFIERRPPKFGNVLGVIIVTLGLILLTSPEGSAFNLGDGLTLMAAFLFGLYIVYLDIFGKESDSAQLTWMQFVTSAAFGAVALLLFETPRLNVTLFGFGAIGYLVVFATVIAIYVQSNYQKETTPTRSAIIFSIEPVIAAGLSYIFLGEVLGWQGILGACLIFGGLLVSELSDLIFRNSRGSLED